MGSQSNPGSGGIHTVILGTPAGLQMEPVWVEFVFNCFGFVIALHRSRRSALNLLLKHKDI